jgi:hypothetical protein
MTGPTTLLPFQPATMSTVQLAAVAYLARYAGRTHLLYAFQLHEVTHPSGAAQTTHRAISESARAPLPALT